jgi:hypothetical protein
VHRNQILWHDFSFVLCRYSGGPIALPSPYSRTVGPEFDKSSKKFCFFRVLAVSSGDDRVQLVLGVDNTNAKVSGGESLNGVAEPGRDFLETDVFDGTKSVRAKKRCNASRLETAGQTFTNFLKLFGPLLF